ncbi:DUF4031 domain-containing protein [Paraburkholderia sp. EG287A]|uniref:DUF4031 domain-containing protein n=1 Tax=Paraburkholderia sp. EG287A TaxID=3237012 RepID=UPI0034D2F05F
MAVYVDDMYLYSMGRLGRLKCSHMIADTDEELHAMAARIGIARKHWQSPQKTSGSHYDIAMSKRALAINAGAVAISMKQLAAMNARRRETGVLGEPETAIEWLLTDRKARRAAPESSTRSAGLLQQAALFTDDENPASS